MTPLYTPNDYNLSGTDYALDLINAQGAWDITHGSDSIVIGISDQNYAVSHEELLGKVNYYNSNNTALYNSWNFCCYNCSRKYRQQHWNKFYRF